MQIGIVGSNEEHPIFRKARSKPVFPPVRIAINSVGNEDVELSTRSTTEGFTSAKP